MTEVVLDVKLASLGVLNITPRGLTDSQKTERLKTQKLIFLILSWFSMRVGLRNVMCAFNAEWARAQKAHLKFASL